MNPRLLRFLSSQQVFVLLYLYQFTLQAFLRSIVPLFTAGNYSLAFRFSVFALEFWFLGKATIALIFRQAWKEETFCGYSVRFPNYLEFVLLFVEIFGIQEYKLHAEKKDLSIVDCGSGWGMSILYFKHLYPRARILAIEANRQTVGYLRGNIARNRLKGVTVRNAFVCATNGTHAFYSYHGFDGWSVSDTGAADFVKTHDEFQKISIPSVSLACLLRRGADVVKLDIEGMEGEALASAKEELRSVSEVIGEHHPGMNRKRNTFEQIERVLKDAGFTISYVNTKSLIPSKNSLRMIYAIRK